MSILNNLVRKTLTASSGSASETFNSNGTCQQIIVQPATASTQYDISLIDVASLVVFKRTSKIGNLNALVTLPLAGAYTLSITNATVDEAHKVFIGIRNS